MTTLLSSAMDQRSKRAHQSLVGLSVGDAFGERFFLPAVRALAMIQARSVPQGPWPYTDDTEMATALVDVLDRHHTIDRDVLAHAFAKRFIAQPWRGYGSGAQAILQLISEGVSWSEVANAVFDGKGSMGNGGAMRSAPVGAWFADDLDAVVKQSMASAEVTHAHPEGQAGAVAVALASAYACRHAVAPSEHPASQLIPFVLEHLPEGELHGLLRIALDVPIDGAPTRAAQQLGSGYRVIAQDTVPFALWCAARHFNDFEAAMWTTVEGLGDRDTTCAIVGGIVAMSASVASIPQAWLTAREAPRHDLGLIA